MFMFFIIVFASLIMLGSVWASYSPALKFSRDRLLGFALSQHQYEHPQVQALCSGYRKELKRLMLICLLLHVPLLGLLGWYTSIFIISYTLWCLCLFLGCYRLIKKYIRRLYQLKISLGWYPASDYSYTTSCAENQKLSTKMQVSVDTEHCWAKGYYYNPNDSRLLVSSPLQSNTNMSYSLNMARTGAKILLAFFWGILGAFMLWLIIHFLIMDFTPYQIHVADQNLIIEAPYYSTEFPLSSVREVKLLDEVPESYFNKLHRTNGADTSQFLLGNFKNPAMGKAKLYYYKDFLPVIEVRQSEYTILFNTRDSGKTREIYEMLQKEMK